MFLVIPSKPPPALLDCLQPSKADITKRQTKSKIYSMALWWHIVALERTLIRLALLPSDDLAKLDIETNPFGHFSNQPFGDCQCVSLSVS